MIIDLPQTTVSAVAKRLVSVREEGGAVALGRVLTLIVATEPDAFEEAVEAANDASREHPMRVIVLTADPEGPARIDAQIRVGGDAGASEVIVLHASGDACSNEESLVTGLLLPDAPVVVWWPDEAPEDPANSPLGRIAQRRITDASIDSEDAAPRLGHLSKTYAPGDTDIAWTRLTRWREQLAAVLDQPPYERITAIEVIGSESSPSTILLAAWLKLQLDAPITLHTPEGDDWLYGIHGVKLIREASEVQLRRIEPEVAVLSQTGQPDHEMPFPRRTLRDCIAEELRRLDADPIYGRVITSGFQGLAENKSAS